MQAVEALAAGVRGAENGTVRINLRGTSTRAPFYSSFEGAIHVSSGNDLDLDANGSAVVYVSSLVDVVVKDEDGVTVREFVSGSTAANVEVVNTSFTGTDYTDGTSGAGEPTTMHEVLSAWMTSAGAVDFKVLFNGTATLLQNALGGVAGIFYNVKSPEYGAEGDGVTDDTTAVQAALTAAGAADGGIVFFPSGQYRLTAGLTVPAGVSVWGAGADATTLGIDHATANLLTYGTGDAVAYQELRGVSLEALQANTGILLNVTGVRRVAATHCTFAGVGTIHTGTCAYLANNSGHLKIEGCRLFVNGVSALAVDADQGATAYLVITGNHFKYVTAGAYNAALVLGWNVVAIGNTFDLSQATSGTMYCLSINTAVTGAQARIVGNHFIGATGGSNFGVYLNGIDLATSYIFEDANTFTSALTLPIFGFLDATNNPSVCSGSRLSLRYQVAHTGTSSCDVNAENFGVTVIQKQDNGSFTIDTDLPHDGALFTLIFWNSSGGAYSGTVTYGTNFRGATTFTSVADNNLEVRHFRCMRLSDGTRKLVPLGNTQHDI